MTGVVTVNSTGERAGIVPAYDEKAEDVDLQVARERLEAMRTDLTSSAEVLARENAGDSGELSTVDQHPADSATNLADADREEAALEVVRTQLEQVRAALGRIEAGTYGKCVTCGQALPDERLDARPEAARCVACQQKLEGGR